MSLGSCLVANEPLGMAEKIVEMRINGANWTEIKQEFGISSAQARKLFTQGSGGLVDFKLTGQKLKDLIDQGTDAIKQASEKAALKKLKKLDDVVPGKSKHAVPDLSKHKVDWPEPSKVTIKDSLKQKLGYNDKDFDNMLDMWKSGKNKDYIVDHFSLKNSEWDQLIDVWKAEGKLGGSTVKLTGVDTKKWDDLTSAVDHVKEMNPEIQQQLYSDVVKYTEDMEQSFIDARNAAKEKYFEYLDKYEGTAKYDQAVADTLKQAHSDAVKAYNKFLQDTLPGMQEKIDAVAKAIESKPALIPDIPVNQPIKNKFTSDVNIAQKTGLTQEQIDNIIKLNKDGKFYTEIKSATGADFAEIDEVIWNDLLKKHNGFTWRAYTEKPTSENGFNAVKEKVFEARGKGLTVKEIAAKPGAPPETVINAILEDKWKLPSPGTKVPIIPPPPPPPPQVFGGTIPSQSGVSFRRHGNEEMLDWIRPDTALLPSGQRSAITKYTNSGYHDINTYLRGGGLTDTQGYGYTGSNVVKTINNLDATMRPLPVDTVVTRNFTGVNHLPAKPEDMVGLVYHDNAFLSTTVKESGVFGGDVQLIIHCPQGTMGRYVNDISIHTNEQELLLARGTKMVVTKVEKHGDGYSTKWRLFCEVIPG